MSLTVIFPAIPLAVKAARRESALALDWKLPVWIQTEAAALGVTGVMAAGAFTVVLGAFTVVLGAFTVVLGA